MWKRLTSIILLATVIGCGYGFTGGVNNLPPDVRSIAIPVFSNNTSELGIETIFTNAVIDEFLHSNLLPIKDESQADAVLLGTIKSIDISSLAYDRRDVSIQNRLTLYLDIVLRTQKDGTVLWQVKNLADNQEFEVCSDPVRTEANRKEAIREIAIRTAEKIHYRTFENF
ncbi:MAG TPA: hypothetical protein EYP21_00705 [Syntrophaceae bacterium]|nr:hypothetical protein [Syntrophaceae bacterium]